MKDYYKILEVSQTASSDVISKVYKVLAKKYHPDTQTNSEKLQEAEEKFKEISEAYEILSHPDSREKYDKELEENQKSKYVEVKQYTDLYNYCKKLENQINLLNSSNNSYTNSTPNYSNNINYSNIEQQIDMQAYQDAMNKAYTDTYYNTLRNLGYKIRYKKTFKEYMQNLLAVTITFVIIAVIGFIAYQIPACRNYFINLLTF